jgi:hypothetical protein
VAIDACINNTDIWSKLTAMKLAISAMGVFCFYSAGASASTPPSTLEKKAHSKKSEKNETAKKRSTKNAA